MVTGESKDDDLRVALSLEKLTALWGWRHANSLADISSLLSPFLPF